MSVQVFIDPLKIAKNLSRTLLQGDEDAALSELEGLLAPRMQSAGAGLLLEDSVEAVFDEVADELRG